MSSVERELPQISTLKCLLPVPLILVRNSSLSEDKYVQVILPQNASGQPFQRRATRLPCANTQSNALLCDSFLPGTKVQYSRRSPMSKSIFQDKADCFGSSTGTDRSTLARK